MMLPTELLPVPDDVSRPYFEGASSGELVLQYCNNCASWVFFPRVACPHCFMASLSTRKASGRGVLYSFAVVVRPHHVAFEDRVPIIFASVELEEGPMMLSELHGMEGKEPVIGMPLSVDFLQVADGVHLPIWRPA